MHAKSMHLELVCLARVCTDASTVHLIHTDQWI